MGNLGNKEIMAKNIRGYMEISNLTAKDVCSALKIPMATFSDWTHAKTYPRIDKIEMLANYFGVSKADLVEEKPLDSIEEQLDTELIGRLIQLTPDELAKVDAFVQGLLASR